MKNRLCKISLFSVILACATNTPVDARVSVKKHSNYADGYNQVMSMRQKNAYMSQNEVNATTASATGDLPVAVDDKSLEKDILNNSASTVNTATLESCSMIYPNGVFRWGVPETGIRRNPNQQCIAVIELKNANTNEVLATTTLASGDAMKCNIDMFPESGWMDALNDIELPSDEPPTLAQVEQIMNQEQKQNAGLKIAAAAIVSGVAGNMLAPKPAGDNKLLGTSKTQLIDTAIGATAGAGIMAASTYSGKVAGDTIKSTAVNAATGMIVGNMAAGMSGGSSILSVVKCEVDGIEKDCVVGNARIADSKSTYTDTPAQSERYFINAKKSILKCDYAKCQTTNDMETNPDCEKSCHIVPSNTLINIKISVNGKEKAINEYGWNDSDWDNSLPRYEKKSYGFAQTSSDKDWTNENVFYPITYGVLGKGSDKHAYAVFESLPRKIGGYKTADWYSLDAMAHTYYDRNRDGTVGSEIKTNSGEEVFFDPSQYDASDGALVDLSNPARTKATITGAVAGGAIGGFAGYQGAKQEVSERWTAAVREYNDSLYNFYCVTGARPLAKYNDYVEIPTMKSE